MKEFDDQYDYDQVPIESWQEDESTFDHDAGYFQADEPEEEEGFVAASAECDVDEYDSAYATYLDARRRFADLKLSRGYLPIVALQDDNASPSTSPPRTPSRGKGPRKGKGGKKGKSSSDTVRYPPRSGGKAPDPRARSTAAIQCLCCGGSSHMAANCPKQSKTSGGTSSPSSPSKRQHTEGMAASSTPMDEAGHVIFEDQQGRQRVDATMIDPGASAYLMGTGPFHRYVEHLKGLQYDTDSIQLTRIQRVFHFGGDHSVTRRWQARVPVFFNHACGYITGFLIPGETPMLMGRPVLENLGLTINFQKKLTMWENAPWQEITIGRRGEYLLPLTSDFRPEMLSQPPSFDLVLADSALTDTDEPYTVNLKTYMNVEGVSQDSGHSSEADGSKKVILKDWKRLDNSLNHHERQLQAMVTAELHSGPRPRLIWEIYAGASRVSEIAQSLGCKVEVFGYETGWDFDIASHRKALLDKQAEELPDEVFLAPRCGLWSKRQSLSANTPERQERLREERQHHHDVHLRFVRQIYRRQVLGARRAHLEQPKEALSWQTRALLPGFHVDFHQCANGAFCKDADHQWRPVLKPTALRTTKKAMAQAMNRTCDKSHDHCRLEGHMPGGRLRTKYLEDYQPAMASIIAVNLAAEETPQTWNYGFAGDEASRSHQGRLVQLLTNNQQEAVRVVQKLHRNLGHPTPEKLCDLLQARGAADTILEVAKTYKCASCEHMRKPAHAAPSSAKVISTFNEQVQCDVM